MNSYAAASVDTKDSVACLQSYHRAGAGTGFIDYGRLYQSQSQSSAAAAAAYLDHYRLHQQSAGYGAGEQSAPAGPYSLAGKTAAGAGGYEQYGYGNFFDLQETFRRDQRSLLHDAGGLKRLDSAAAEKTAASRSDVERAAGAAAGDLTTESGSVLQIKCEDGAPRPSHRPQTSISHHQHHHHHQQQHASSQPAAVAGAGCSPTKHHHSKHAATDSIKSSKGRPIDASSAVLS